MVKVPKRKIRLLIDLPIHRSHGAKKGEVFAVTRQEGPKLFFMGKAGVACTAWWPKECRILDKPKRKPKCVACGGTGVSSKGRPCVCQRNTKPPFTPDRKRHKSPIEADLIPAQDVRRSSKYWDFNRDGVSPSAIECFLRCREEFRLSWVEGWQDEGYSVHLDFGNVWHALTADRLRLASPTKKQVIDPVAKWLKAYRKRNNGTMLPADLEDQALVDTQTIAMWGLYCETYPEDHKDEPLIIEEIVKEKIYRPGVNTTWLRGTVDFMFKCHKGRGNRARELKTKAQINMQQLEDLLLLDNQAMVYGLLAWVHSEVEPSGIDYDLVRRPSCKPKKREGETLQQYGKRLHKKVEKEGPHYFSRIEKDIPPGYLKKWKEAVLSPILTEIGLWAKGELAHYPSGAQSLVARPWGSRFIPMISRQDRGGMKQAYSYDYQTKE